MLTDPVPVMFLRDRVPATRAYVVDNSATHCTNVQIVQLRIDTISQQVDLDFSIPKSI